MRLRKILTAVLPLILTICAVSAIGQGAGSPAAPRKAMATPDYGRLPLSFEANQGQTDPRVKFLSRGNGYSLFLTDGEAVLELSKARRSDDRNRRSNGKGAPGQTYESDVVGMRLDGAKAGARVTGLDVLPGTANYFIGSDPAKWREGLATYRRVEYTGVYPGVDLIYYGNQRQLEYDFVVAPGADTKPIRLRFRGAKKLSLSPDGDLIVAATHGAMAFHKPVLYQTIDGRRAPVEGRFTLLTGNGVGFSLGMYDHTKPLVIDPVLVYATYLGGKNGGLYGDYASAIAVDADGNTYLTGTAVTISFPVTDGAFQPRMNASSNATNAFVTKLDPTGTSLVYSTFLGGSTPVGRSDFGLAIAVNGSGNAYVAGAAATTDFPVTSGAFQTTSGGGQWNAFITKLSSDGTSLEYSTYLGGGPSKYNSTGDFVSGIALDSAGDAYVAGTANSTNFPVSSNAFQKVNNAADNGFSNGFIAKLNPTGTGLLYSTYLGGPGESGEGSDAATAIAIDASGNAYVTGHEYSTYFPVTSGVFQTVNNGEENAFVTKLNPTGTALVYSTCLGGDSTDAASGIAVDASGDAYVTGITTSADFPVTTGAFQTAHGGYSESGFLTKVNSTGTKLVYSTFLGGAQTAGPALALDGLGEAYVFGSTYSTTFPVTKGAFQIVDNSTRGGSNAFLTKFNATGTALLYSTYLGGGINDYGLAIALDSSNDAYVAGQAYSTNFPVTTGAFQTDNNGASASSANAFVAKLAIGGETTTAVTSSANPQLQGFAVTLTAAVTGNFSNAIPTGSVVFSIDGGTGITVDLDETGKATYSTSALAPVKNGHVISVTYSGDANFVTSNGSLNEIIIGPPASIAVVSGAGQTGPYGSAFASTLIAIVKDANGYAVPSAMVTFSGAGLKFSSNPATTGSNGEAIVTATAEAAGSLTATASVTGVTGTAVFPLTANKVLLTLSAINVTVPYDQPIPTLFFNLAGLVNGDTSKVLTGALSETTTAKKGSPVGTYPILMGPGTLAAVNYNFNLVNGSLAIVKAKQTITFAAPATPVTYGVKATKLTATASSGLPVTLSVVSGPAKISAGTLTITAAGTVIVGASQAGNSNWLAATVVKRTIVVKKAAQKITLTAPPTTVTYGVKPITLAAKSTSGLAVVFSVVSGPAKLSAHILTVTGVGTVVVAANQEGNVDYLAAPKVSQTIKVAKASSLITLKSSASSVKVGTLVTFTATLSGGGVKPTGAVEFMDGTKALGAASANTAGVAVLATSKLAAGTHSITAVYAGNVDYLPKTSTAVKVTVSAQ